MSFVSNGVKARQRVRKKEIMFMLLLLISLRAKGMAYSLAVYIKIEFGSRLVIM